MRRLESVRGLEHEEENILDTDGDISYGGGRKGTSEYLKGERGERTPQQRILKCTSIIQDATMPQIHRISSVGKLRMD